MKVSTEDFRKYLTISQGLAKKSVDTYCIRFKLIDQWLSKSNLDLTRKSVEDFLYEKKIVGKLGNSAINTYIQTLKHIEGCYKYHDIVADFMTGISNMPKTHPNIVPLSKDEVEQLLSMPLTYKNRNGVDCSDLDTVYLTLTEFLTYTGARFEEGATLRVGELDIDNGRATLLQTKNRDNRYVFFRGPIKDHLKELIKGKTPDSLVFTNSLGKRIYPTDYNENLKVRAKKAGITKKIHAHLLRHTYATLLYNTTKDITLVAKVLGHRDVQTTFDTYVHLDTEGIQRGTDKHPLVSDFISPQEVLQNVRRAIENYRLNEDDRFIYKLLPKSGGLQVKIKIKKRQFN